MGVLPKDPAKRREFARLVRIILVVITIGFITVVVFMILGFSEADKRKFVYKSCVNNLYQKQISLKHARLKFESGGSPETEKELREAEKEYDEAVRLKVKALSAMKEMGLEYDIKTIDAEAVQKYSGEQ